MQVGWGQNMMNLSLFNVKGNIFITPRTYIHAYLRFYPCIPGRTRLTMSLLIPEWRSLAMEKGRVYRSQSIRREKNRKLPFLKRKIQLQSIFVGPSIAVRDARSFRLLFPSTSLFHIYFKYSFLQIHMCNYQMKRIYEYIFKLYIVCMFLCVNLSTAGQQLPVNVCMFCFSYL